jgi:hypothetical protein
MSLNNLKKKKLIIIAFDGSFLITKNTLKKKIVFFEKDDRNSIIWLKLFTSSDQLNNVNYRDKFLK